MQGGGGSLKCRTAANNLVTLEDEVKNYYQQVHYQEESDDEYESDEDEGP